MSIRTGTLVNVSWMVKRIAIVNVKMRSLLTSVVLIDTCGSIKLEKCRHSGYGIVPLNFCL